MIELLIFSIIINLILFNNIYNFHRKKDNYKNTVFTYVLITSILLFCTNLVLNYADVFNKIIFITFLLLLCLVLIGYYFLLNFYINRKIKLINIIFSVALIFITFIVFIFEYNSISFTNLPDNLIYYFSKNIFLYIPAVFIIFSLLIFIYKSCVSKIKFNYYVFFSLIFLHLSFTLNFVFGFYLFIPAISIVNLILCLEHNSKLINFDSLTGLYNRRILDNNQFDRRISGKKITGMFVIDVDKFKYINDTYGHNYGDKILKEVSNIIQKSIRQTDLAIRTGGDEFLIIVYLNNKQELELVNKKLLSNLKKHNKNLPFVLDLSIGYGIYNQEKCLEEFILELDKKMYIQKQNKNK